MAQRPARTGASVRALGFCAVLALAMFEAHGQVENQPMRTWSKRVFAETISFRYPDRFTRDVEAANPLTYRHTFLLEGESLERWSEVIAVQVFKDDRAMTKQTPGAFLRTLEDVTRKTCAGAVTLQSLRPAEVRGYEAAAAVMRCGAAPGRGDADVETTLSVVIAGRADLFVIDWAERGAASRASAAIDVRAWEARLRQLEPLHVCTGDGDAKACAP